MINKFRNKISYDINTGKVTNQKNTMTMLEDFYFPVTEGGRGTKVETLESGQRFAEEVISRFELGVGLVQGGFGLKEKVSGRL